MRTVHQWLTAVVVGTVILLGIGFVHFDWLRPAQTASQAVDSLPASLLSDPISALPLSLPLDPRKVALGERLFHEGRLSADHRVSCAHCHNLATGGVDHRRRSQGVGGHEGSMNAPTVFNSGFNFRQFWDGRAETLEDQVDGPLQHPLEMAGTWRGAVAMLSEDDTYRADFAATYPDGISPRNIRDAIATFERSLITPNSRFDQFLRGNQNVLTETEQAGYRLFKQIGCTSCHQGMAIGGNMYQKLGIMEDYFSARGHLQEADLGRYNITKLEEDRYVFKVPSLRNIAVTAPYLHDASAATLEDAIAVMARYQLGLDLDKQDVARIAAFLRTLTGEYQGKLLQ
ncbi:cytochrome-c peroxidase [Rhodoferax sp.]|uniref:cytochrome-c peroxidase n=1 Tax=Rhodoferax sp. TaxID=50421 RepID=UPI00261C5CD9|nr:cytochrome-c peroxidase [Rhodoferax sp.]MDD2926327.1 cytochrome-c peroxidase [Rhodoferax sp.]